MLKRGIPLKLFFTFIFSLLMIGIIKANNLNNQAKRETPAPPGQMSVIQGTAALINSVSVEVSEGIFIFIFPQIVAVSPFFGTTGSCIAVTGAGYRADEEVQVNFGTTLNISQGRADVHGIFTIAFTIDQQPVGPAGVVTCGLTSGVTNADLFFVLPTLLSPSFEGGDSFTSICKNLFSTGDDRTGRTYGLHRECVGVKDKLETLELRE